MKNILRFVYTPILILGLFLPFANPQPVRAAAYGYLWSLTFDFETNFDGVLTIEVGPWENGDLVSVDETSRAIVPCRRVGDVFLDSGDAVFGGAGYLTCEMNLQKIVRENHGLTIGDLDTYGSIVMHTRLSSNVNALAPIFTHPDAIYSVDFTQTQAATLTQSLHNGVGPMQATFGGVTINNMENFTAEYICDIAGPCFANYAAGPQQQNQPIAGAWTQFSTGRTSFDIGHNNGLILNGRMAALEIDPGNSAH